MSVQGGSTDHPSRRVQEALRLLRERARTRVSIAEVAATVGTSTRGLQKLFRAEVGQTPGEYLRAVRLDGVRRDLQSASTGPDRESIATIAARWQFSNAGRMAAAYRAAFGSPPSDALRFFGPDGAGPSAAGAGRRRFRLVLDCEIEVDDLDAAAASAHRRAVDGPWDEYRPDGGAEGVVAYVLGSAVRRAVAATDGVELLAVDPVVRVPDALGGYRSAELPARRPSPPTDAPRVGSEADEEGRA